LAPGPYDAVVRLLSPIGRTLWLLLAVACLGLALVGVVVPLLPTTPFALLAAYAAARSSTRLHGWLLASPALGPVIRDWETHRAVSGRTKLVALATMTVTAVVIGLVAPSPVLALGTIAVMGAVATWLWLRPEPPVTE
jgi:uncharacterized membrane protein YbaN (DUF454 family)